MSYCIALVVGWTGWVLLVSSGNGTGGAGEGAIGVMGKLFVLVQSVWPGFVFMVPVLRTLSISISTVSFRLKWATALFELLPFLQQFF